MLAVTRVKFENNFFDRVEDSSKLANQDANPTARSGISKHANWLANCYANPGKFCNDATTLIVASIECLDTVNPGIVMIWTPSTRTNFWFWFEITFHELLLPCDKFAKPGQNSMYMNVRRKGCITWVWLCYLNPTWFWEAYFSFLCITLAFHEKIHSSLNEWKLVYPLPGTWRVER